MTRRSRRDGNRASTAIALLLAGVLALVGATGAVADHRQGHDAGGDDATIEVEWDEDGMGFTANSTKDISNIWVEFCPGDKHKHDNLNTKEFTHREDEQIAGIWVKSGNNGQEDNQPPGAGERFDNDFVDCDPGEECEGPDDIRGEALENEVNRLNWTSVEGADGYNLYRAVEDGSFEKIATVPTTEYMDTDVEQGTTYTYFVTATFDDTETDWCEEIEITAIPTFPTVFTVAAASIGGLALYGTYRYRTGG